MPPENRHLRRPFEQVQPSHNVKCVRRQAPWDDEKLRNTRKARNRLEYKGRSLKQEYESDFVCYGEIILEIKVVKQLADEHRARVINYLKATGMQLGLLVNFGHYPKIEHERFVNQRL
jgi:GxxExxY protein